MSGQRGNQAGPSEFAVSFEEHIRAGYQALYVNTSEEARVEKEISEVAARLDPRMDIIFWDCYEGFSKPPLSGDPKLKAPHLALDAIASEKSFKADTICVFRDLEDFMADPQVARRVKSLTEGNKLVNNRQKRPLVIISARMHIPPKLKSCLTVLDFNLPSPEHLHKTVRFVQAAVVKGNTEEQGNISPELRELIVTNLLGLTSIEAENCLSRCLVKHGGFAEDMLRTIKEEKAGIIKKSDVLTYIPEDGIAARDEIGGFEEYLTWLDRRKLAYLPEAREARIDFPKGVVVVGLPGTGKSMVAKATCKLLGLPGYILDVGAVFGSMVGESEQRMRDAIKQISAQQGCVLVVDEADKGFGNAHNSQGDSGVTKRVFGSFLSWLAEKQDRTFVIMTLNRTAGLPPELLRAGRFDATFYTDLPGDQERRAIFDIHLRKRGVDPASLGFKKADWSELIKKSNGYVGSEIEEAVREARYMAFEHQRTGLPTFEQLHTAISSIVPLSQSNTEGMEEIRTFCKDRARPVSRQYQQEEPAGRAQRRVDLGGKSGDN